MALLTTRDLSTESENYSDQDLRFSRIDFTNFYSCSFRNANLSNSVFFGCKFFYCDFAFTDFHSTYFSHCEFINCNFAFTNFTNCSFGKSNFKDNTYANTAIGLNLCCPEVGEYTGFKVCSHCIVTLKIPSDAKRSSATTRKCRASKAKVLSIEDLFTGKQINSVHSDYDPNFIYTVGETVEVPNFDEDRWKECAPGIHHFITRHEAIDYSVYGG